MDGGDPRPWADGQFFRWFGEGEQHRWEHNAPYPQPGGGQFLRDLALQNRFDLRAVLLLLLA